jgi:hypothetical protein
MDAFRLHSLPEYEYRLKSRKINPCSEKQGDRDFPVLSPSVLLAGENTFDRD